MKIVAVFLKFLRISETKSAFWGQKTTVSNSYGNKKTAIRTFLIFLRQYNENNV